MITKAGSPEHRMWLLNQFHECIRREVVPAIHADLGGQAMDVIASGASIGAFNAVAVLCRYPDVFSAAIGMSGSYRIERFYDQAWSQDLYFSAPLQFLPGLDGPQLDLLRQRYRRARVRGGRVGGHRRVLADGISPGREGDPQPGGQLGPAVGARLANVAPDAAAVPRASSPDRARGSRHRGATHLDTAGQAGIASDMYSPCRATDRETL